jgi:hypothetical protein
MTYTDSNTPVSVATEDDFRPSAARLVDSLRDTGYSPEAAFADVIDNSIAAGANRIRIELGCLFGDVRVTFLDNGAGMTEDELKAAMRYGSPKRPDPKSLGKFGMGLKTASTAFCERLTVISYRNGTPSIRAWDIDTIRQTDQWRLETPDWRNYADDRAEVEEFAAGTGSATMVIWEKVDRLVTLGDDQKVGRQLEALGKELAEELSAVFARFLDRSCSDYPDVDIALKVNGAPETLLVAWHPLCLSLNTENTVRVQQLPRKSVGVTLPDGSKTGFTVTGSILPVQSALTAAEQDSVRYSLDNQGFYIYREGRLIWHEGWPPRMYKKEGKMTRLRVVLDFTHELDDVFKIDFRKSRIIIPSVVREELKKIVAPWRNHTLTTSSGRDAAGTGGGGGDTAARHQRATNAIDKHSEHTKTAKVTVEGEKATLQNKYNLQPVEAEGIHVYRDSGIRVREEPSLEGNVLWCGALDEDGEVCVQLGRSHPYFSRLYATCRDNPDAMMALDMLLWTLANAEIGIWSEKNKAIVRDYRQQVSSSLNILCEELPDPADD